MLHDLQRAGLDPGALVEETLALLVDVEEGALELVRAGVSPALGVQHGREGSGLHGAADPQDHLVAVAGVGSDGRIHARHGEGLGAVVAAHLLVAGNVARGDDDALGGNDLLVAVGVGHDSARHRAGLVLQQVLGLGVEAELGAVLDGLEVAHVGRDEGAAGDGEVALVGAAHADVAGLVGKQRVAAVAVPDAHGAVMLLAGLAQPVSSLAGASHVLGDEGLVAAVAAGLHPAELCRGDVGHGAVLEGDGQLGVPRTRATSFVWAARWAFWGTWEKTSSRPSIATRQTAR